MATSCTVIQIPKKKKLIAIGSAEVEKATGIKTNAVMMEPKIAIGLDPCLAIIFPMKVKLKSIPAEIQNRNWPIWLVDASNKILKSGSLAIKEPAVKPLAIKAARTATFALCTWGA